MGWRGKVSDEMRAEAQRVRSAILRILNKDRGQWWTSEEVRAELPHYSILTIRTALSALTNKGLLDNTRLSNPEAYRHRRGPKPKAWRIASNSAPIDNPQL